MKLFWLIAAAVGALFFFFRPKSWTQKGRMEVPPAPGQDPTTVPGMTPETERIRDAPSADELVTFILDIGERVIDTGRDLPTGVAIAALGQTVIALDVGGLNQPLIVVQIGSGPISQIRFQLGSTPFGPEVALTEGSVVQTLGWLGALPAIIEIGASSYRITNSPRELAYAAGLEYQPPGSD